MKIQNYLYPAKEGVKRKGIVYFVHGYGEYNGRYAYLGKGFSEAGYDFAGID
jgi:alpha-beta hydrolase superfamily lysophospholipase